MKTGGASNPAVASDWLHRWNRVALILVAATLIAAPLDLPTVEFIKTHRFPGVLRDLLEMSEAFGHALGVCLIILAVCLLDPLQRRQAPRMLCATLGAGIVADVFKLIFPRYRPRAAGMDFSSFWGTFEVPFTSFSLQDKLHSFPSAHTTVAFGLVVCLAYLYPRGRKLFVFVAILCALQRVQSRSHYLTDVLCGAALGLTVGSACFRIGWLSEMLDRAGDQFSGQDTSHAFREQQHGVLDDSAAIRPSFMVEENSPEERRTAIANEI